MTAHDEARRRLIADAMAIDDDAAMTVRRATRGDRVRAATNAALVAATTSAVTVGPMGHAVAAEPAAAGADVGPVDRADGSRGTAPQPAPAPQSAPAPQPAPAPPAADVADVIVADVVAAHALASTDAGPPAQDVPAEGPADLPVDGVPGLDPVVVIPLNGRESRPIPRQPAPAGGGVVLPNVQPDSPAGDRLPPTQAPPESEPTTPLPPRPTVDVIVGTPPAPQPVGGVVTDLSQDFTDPAISGDVVTTPLPLEGTTTHVVVAGDSLWSIATQLLTADEREVTTSEVGAAVQVIYEANREVIGPDPDLLAIGTVLEIPDQLVPADDEASNQAATDAANDAD